MIHYKLDYVIEHTLKEQPNREQIALCELADVKLSKKEAIETFERIVDHKWYVSERLGRDVGMRVAAIDYFENIQPVRNKKINTRTLKDRVLNAWNPSTQSI